MKKRRLKRANISAGLLVNMFRTDNIIEVRVLSGLPQDVKLIGIDAIHGRDEFSLILEHDSFDEVPMDECTPLPYLEITVKDLGKCKI